MPLSTPIFILKRQARALSRKEAIPLHAALDRLAVQQGYRSWSLLSAKAEEHAGAIARLPILEPGDLLLLAARPRQGKTLMSLRMAVEAMKRGQRCVFFSLEYDEAQFQDRLGAIGADYTAYRDRLVFDGSDDISHDYMMGALETAGPGTLVVVDYLQLLDQKRSNAALTIQIAALRAFARARHLCFVFLSQIDRSYNTSGRPIPDITDIRQPNPVDLSLFDKALFLHEGRVRLHAA